MAKKKITIPGNIKEHLEKVLHGEPSPPPDDMDWDTFGKYLGQEKVFNAYYLAMEKAGLLDLIPKDLADNLKVGIDAYRIINRRHLSEAVRVSELLKENGFDIIFLKGIPNLVEIFHDISEHPMEDVDALVHEDEMKEIRSLLADELGYFPLSVLPGFELFHRRDEREGKVKLLRNPEPGYPPPILHLHTIIGGALFHYKGEKFFKNPRTITLEGKKIKVLQHRDHFIHMCIHWAGHLGGRSDFEFRRLGLVRFLEKFGPILNWEEIVEEFRYRRLLPCLVEVLRVTGFSSAAFLDEPVKKKIRLSAQQKFIIKILQNHRLWLARYLSGFHNCLWPDRRRLTAFYGELPGTPALLKAWFKSIVSIIQRLWILLLVRFRPLPEQKRE
ncbi:MAG: nucleotidyltransferase family protein [Candidatus Eremiobacteraeota bacterium]|nr:nucleotidyltransferase family protein [Candidatus Eremiobacteraeota bacterium]